MAAVPPEPAAGSVLPAGSVLAGVGSPLLVSSPGVGACSDSLAGVVGSGWFSWLQPTVPSPSSKAVRIDVYFMTSVPSHCAAETCPPRRHTRGCDGGNCGLSRVRHSVSLVAERFEGGIGILVA